MTRITVTFTLVAGLFLLNGCTAFRPQDDSPTVAVIGSKRMTLREFEAAYAKNNGGWEKGAAASLEERERFLDLLVKFKLKVREARERGLERDSSVQYELESYGASIAMSYMLDKELIEPNVRKLYAHMKEEVKASHVLIRVAPNASPGDTAAAYQKAMEIIAQVPTVPFDSLALKYSEDQSAATNYGNLGYFSGGRMVPEFEDAAYRLPAGEYSRTPVRTQFGYHVIKVVDRRPASGSIRISHILLRFSDTLHDTTAVTDSAGAVYNLITGGLDFAAAARQYSQDPTTTGRGGDLGFFDRARLPEHIAAQFYEKPIGTVFEPMRFPYGYHIFKTTERKPVPEFAELERDLRGQYQNTRYEKDYEKFLHGLKKKHQLTLNVPTVYEFTHAFDTTATPTRSSWSDTLRPGLMQRPLMTLAGKAYLVRDLVDFITTGGEFKNTLLTSTNVETIVERYTEIKVLEHEAQNVPQRHPEFEKLMKEYEDGILLFKIEQDEVWNIIDTSAAALHNYYETHIEDYRVPDLVNVQEILLMGDSLAHVVYKKILAGEDFGELAAQYSERPTMKEKKGIWGLKPVDHRDITKKAWTIAVDSISRPFQADEGWAIIKVLEKQPSRIKKFDEVASEVANAYREYASKRREEEWMEELKKKYGVVVSKEPLANAFREKPGETP